MVEVIEKFRDLNRYSFIYNRMTDIIVKAMNGTKEGPLISPCSSSEEYERFQKNLTNKLAAFKIRAFDSDDSVNRMGGVLYECTDLSVSYKLYRIATSNSYDLNKLNDEEKSFLVNSINKEYPGYVDQKNFEIFILIARYLSTVFNGKKEEGLLDEADNLYVKEYHSVYGSISLKEYVLDSLDTIFNLFITIEEEIAGQYYEMLCEIYFGTFNYTCEYPELYIVQISKPDINDKEQVKAYENIIGSFFNSEFSVREKSVTSVVNAMTDEDFFNGYESPYMEILSKDYAIIFGYRLPGEDVHILYLKLMIYEYMCKKSELLS